MRGKDRKIRRQRVITDEPMFVDPDLVGKPLATPARRAAAYLADLILILIFVFLSIAAVNILKHPSLLRSCFDYIGEEPGAGRDAAFRRLNARFFGIMYDRNPKLLPADMRAALEARDDSTLAALASSRDFNIALVLDARESTFDEETGQVRLGGDVVTGFGGFSTGVPVFIAWFTIFTWALKGRTPGKALAGIRVIRLDGRRLRLWDSFGRSGGYAASAATGFIGFLEAFWHPNRQTIHDRIAGTVVTREKRGNKGGKGPSESKVPPAKPGKGE